MKQFLYKAKNRNGILKQGLIEAKSDLHAIEMLSQDGLLPLEVESSRAQGPWWQREVQLFGGSAVSNKDLLSVFVPLAALLKHKFPLPEALKFVETQSTSKRLSNALSSIRSHVENGLSFEEAVTQSDHVFPDQITNSLAIGEKSNSMAETVDQIAIDLAAKIRMQGRIKTAMVYPSILLMMSVLVLCLIVFYLTPALVPVFETAGKSPPRLLSVMNGFRSIALESGTLIALVLACVALLAFLLRRSITNMVDPLVRRLPLIGSLLEKQRSQRFCNSLSTLIVAGASVPEAISKIAESEKDQRVQSQLIEVRDLLEAGSDIPTAFNRLEFLDQLTTSLVAAGSASGNLVEMLNAARQNLEGQTNAALDRVIGLLTPAITLVVGGLVATLILTTLGAILDLNDIAI